MNGRTHTSTRYNVGFRLIYHKPSVLRRVKKMWKKKKIPTVRVRLLPLKNRTAIVGPYNLWLPRLTGGRVPEVRTACIIIIVIISVILALFFFSMLCEPHAATDTVFFFFQSDAFFNETDAARERPVGNTEYVVARVKISPAGYPPTSSVRSCEDRGDWFLWRA